MLPSELIAHEKNWIKGTNARDAYGESVKATDKEAVSWCMVGAISKCNCYVSRDMLDTITQKLGMSITHFNDDTETTHADVIIALKSVGL